MCFILMKKPILVCAPCPGGGTDPSGGSPRGRRSSYAGGGWIGLRRNDAFHVTDVTEKPLLPEYAMLALLLVLLLTAWIREGYGAFKKRA